MKILFRPLEDNVILEFKIEKNTTDSGIIVNTQEKEKSSVGIVIAVGPKVSEIKKNDEVIYKNYSGNKIKIENKEYLVISSKDILALL
ncbi:MAG: co-chaperone GroES [Candidatus Phytoplasma pyri]|uniref:co-chaperone GroES n=1 Tax=Candidatus Phytoplasma pyri TaxID=47566 RepID=UPI003983481C